MGIRDVLGKGSLLWGFVFFFKHLLIYLKSLFLPSLVLAVSGFPRIYFSSVFELSEHSYFVFKKVV